MNKKFLALSMLMFASWSGSLMSISPVENSKLIDTYSSRQTPEATKVPGPQSLAQQTAIGMKYVASLSGMQDRGIVDTMFRTKLPKADAEFVVGVPLDSSKVDSSIPVVVAESVGPSQLEIETKAKLTPQSTEVRSIPTLSERAYNAALSTQSSVASGARTAYQSIGQSLSFANAQAQNAGARMGIPNLTGRSIDLANLNDAQTQAITTKFENDGNVSVKTTMNQNGTRSQEVYKNSNGETLTTNYDANGQQISEIYTPAPTKINFAARQLRSLYNSLPTLTTVEGRQAFQESVNAMFTRSGQDAPSQRSWSQFFASLKPNMNFSMFSKSVNNNLQKVAPENSKETWIELEDFSNASVPQPPISKQAPSNIDTNATTIPLPNEMSAEQAVTKLQARFRGRQARAQEESTGSTILTLNPNSISSVRSESPSFNAITNDNL